MISTILTMALAPALTPVPGPAVREFEVAPEEVAWEDLASDSFDMRWIVPDDAGGRGLLSAMRDLTVVEYMADGKPYCFGDLVVEARGVPRAARGAWLDRLEERAPRLMRRWGAALRELFQDDYLFSSKWQPSKDHPRDGILMGDGWKFARSMPEPWSNCKKLRFEQGATLYYADLATIKEVENDYRRYPRNAGATYNEIYPYERGHLSGEDPTGQPFRFVRIFFDSDLPFPFSSYGCDLRILNRLDEEGVMRTDIYAAKSDFHYMVGQDVFLPVRDSQGRTVAHLGVRDFAFDLKGVPDGPKHRAEALRSTLGNLRRNSESASGPTATVKEATPSEALASVRVRGSK